MSLDVLGEDVTDISGARRTRNAYVSLLYALSEAGLAADVDVSLKLSALGQAIPGRGDLVATRHAMEICVAADAVRSTVTLDMENHTTVDSTLSIGNELRGTFPMVGNVLQSNLRRTPCDIAALSATGARVRLVKGAYKEPAAVAHQRKAEVEDAYLSDVAALMKTTCYPMIGSHDPAMLNHAVATAAMVGRSVGSWEIQMLYGVRSDLQLDIANAGRQLRVYVPFGSDWYGYFMRRLAERPANVAFFLRALAQR